MCSHDAGWMKSLLGDCQRVLCKSLMYSFSECASFAQTSEYNFVVTSKAVSLQRKDVTDGNKICLLLSAFKIS